MAGFGPAPKPQSQQRRGGRGLTSQTTHLPAAGRQGDTPEWPLGRATKRELVLWARLWRTPQAIEWERLGWADVVARYARMEVIAEQRDAPITALGEVRQMEDRLGLSPMALLRLRWEIVDEAADPAESEPGTLDIRKRLRAVE